jgi:hypothetical protein
MAKNFDYKPWINDAQERLLKLEIGKVFELKDLFTGTEGRDWNDLGTYKSSFGREFSKRVDNGRLIGVEKFNGKYRRIDT